MEVGRDLTSDGDVVGRDYTQIGKAKNAAVGSHIQQMNLPSGGDPILIRLALMEYQLERLTENMMAMRNWLIAFGFVFGLQAVVVVAYIVSRL